MRSSILLVSLLLARLSFGAEGTPVFADDFEALL
jgi:hypothetical protein